MATDSKNLVEEIIDNAIDPSTHLRNEDADPVVPNTTDIDPLKRTHHDPLNENLVPDSDKA
ncbi:MAG TPA: hypothetical protein VK953_02655 [Methylophilus sp.]|nr:hypothetical protein [Methylophilus sp.]